MSVALDPVDLSSAVVGSTGKLDWTGQVQQGSPVGVRPGRATLRIHNESNAGLKLQFSGIKSDRIPAGGWGDYELAGENLVNYVVEYLITGPAPNVLLGVVYEPGEPVPPLQTLGNSSVGVGGTVTTSSASSIKNDGNNPPTSIVEATPGDQASSSVALNNDASGFLKVLSANVLRTILNVVRGNSGVGKATVQLGDSGDATITTLYGSVQGGQPANLGNTTITGTESVSGRATLGALTSDNGGSIVSDGSGGFTAAGYFLGAEATGSSWTNNQGGSLELGAGNNVNPGSAQSPFIDFHSSANARDYDARIIATGGGASDGLGKLSFNSSGGAVFTGQVQDGGGKQYGRMGSAGGGAAGFLVWEGTTDPSGSGAIEGDLWVDA